MLHLHTVESGTLELLKKLSKEPVMAHDFLVGGTSLALQIGHRQSVDLDLFTHMPFDAVELLEYLQKDYQDQPLTVNNHTTGHF